MLQMLFSRPQKTENKDLMWRSPMFFYIRFDTDLAKFIKFAVNKTENMMNLDRQV